MVNQLQLKKLRKTVMILNVTFVIASTKSLKARNYIGRKHKSASRFPNSMVMVMMHFRKIIVKFVSDALV